MLSFLAGVVITAVVGLLLAWRQRQVAGRLSRRHGKRIVEERLAAADTDTLKKFLGQALLPSWVNFPDYERVLWLNGIISQMWPFLNASISTLARSQLEPLLRSYKPPWVQSLQLHRCTLGSKPPTISCVKVYGSQGIADAVHLEADFVWDSQADVQLVIHPVPRQLTALIPREISWIAKSVLVKAGVEDVSINGRARITLRPLTNVLPCIGAVQVSLVEQPSFDFSLTIYGGNASFIPGLEGWLYSLVRDQVFKPYTLPEGYTIQLQDMGFAGEAPAGLLSVKVLKATNVPKHDWLSLTDAFVRLSVRDSQQFTTQVQQNKRNPVWDEQFQLLVHEPEHQQLLLQLMDYDMFGSQEVGRASIPVRELTRYAEAHDLHLKLVDQSELRAQATRSLSLAEGVKGAGRLLVKTKEAVRGCTFVLRGRCEIHLEVHYLHIDQAQVRTAAQQAAETGQVETGGLSPELRSLMQGGMLFVRLVNAEKLPSSPLWKGGFLGMKVKAVVKVGGQTKTAPSVHVHKGTATFNHLLNFVVPGDVAINRNTKMQLQLVDVKYLNHDIGSVEVPLHRITRKRYLQKTLKLQGVRSGVVGLELTWQGSFQYLAA